jgi:hypothetical protein
VSVAVLKSPPDADIVRFLTETLERAKAGEIQGIVVVEMDTNKKPTVATVGRPVDLLGSLAIAQWQIVRGL